MSPLVCVNVCVYGTRCKFKSIWHSKRHHVGTGSIRYSLQSLRYLTENYGPHCGWQPSAVYHRQTILLFYLRQNEPRFKLTKHCSQISHHPHTHSSSPCHYRQSRVSLHITSFLHFSPLRFHPSCLSSCVCPHVSPCGAKSRAAFARSAYSLPRRYLLISIHFFTIHFFPFVPLV